MFSRLSLFLKRLPAKTLPELQWSLYQAFNQPAKCRRRATAENKNDRTPQVRIPVKSFVVETVVDTKEWLAPMNPYLNGTFKGAGRTYVLQGTHAFKFARNQDGDVTLGGKKWATDPMWLVRSLCSTQRFPAFLLNVIRMYVLWLSERSGNVNLCASCPQLPSTLSHSSPR